MPSCFFYDDRQSVPGVGSYSPSANKPARFMERLKHWDLYAYNHHQLPVTPVTRDDLCLAHDKAHVDAVFDGTAPNGFDTFDPRIPEACLWTVGSLATAVLSAPHHQLPVCSPTSGFHHAGHAFSEGYCTFNGLMVAAAKYLQAHPGHKVGILDCDFHYGNGTADILGRLPGLAAHVVHHTSGQFFNDRDTDPLDFFQWLHHSIEDINAQGCNVTIYQAGADMHKDDPLGGILDDEEMARRDSIVFSTVRGALAWNLAGGYRRNPGSDVLDDPVLNTHIATLREVGRTSTRRAALHATCISEE